MKNIFVLCIFVFLFSPKLQAAVDLKDVKSSKEVTRQLITKWLSDNYNHLGRGFSLNVPSVNVNPFVYTDPFVQGKGPALRTISIFFTAEVQYSGKKKRHIEGFFTENRTFACHCFKHTKPILDSDPIVAPWLSKQKNPVYVESDRCEYFGVLVIDLPLPALKKASLYDLEEENNLALEDEALCDTSF